ncbi:MAG: hypothetical protein II725_03645 [Firmicutes bacterium]|nr:hypothetical protein [Bacillota bacterium]
MIKKLTAFFLCALLVVSAALPAFAMERSIQPLSDAVSIDNEGRSVELLYEGQNARVYYGSSGISVVSEAGVKHLGTNFAVKKLAVLPDADGDGYPEFLTYQDAPDHSAQVMTVSGKDGKVLADMHITHSGYDENIGFTDANSFVQQLLTAADGNVLIVYDYSIVKADGKTLETIWTHTAADNIWKAISVGDIDGDSAEDFAYTMQRNTVAILSGADGSAIKEWHPCETRQLNIDWLKKTLDAEMNMWDLVFMNGIIHATSEDGQIFAIDPVSGSCEGTDLNVLEKEYFDNLLIGYNLNYDMGTPTYRHTGINNWPYMGIRIADADGPYLLIDCYQGDADSCAQYQDSSWTPSVMLFNTDTRTVEATLPVSGGYSVNYQKTGLSVYDGTPCIAAATSVTEKRAVINYYDYTGALIYQKEIESPVIGESSRFEISRAEDGLRLEFFGTGCLLASPDLKTLEYAYDKDGMALERSGDSYYLTHSSNGIKDRIVKYGTSLNEKIWEYVLNAEYTNKGFEFQRTDRDYTGDGVNDVMAIVNSYNKDGQTDASWFIILSGEDGSEIFNYKIKTGEGKVDGKKVEYFLIADKLDMIKDLDGDKKPELLCGENVVSSRRRTVIGSLFGGVDAEGRSFKVGDTNGDGLPDFLVVSDKETRLYESRLGMSYGFASVEYRKTNTRIENNKELEPMNTSDLIGDIDADGISEIVLIGKNAQGFQIYKVYNGKTLQLLYDLCPDGISGEGESFISLEYDINGDGIYELYGRNFNWQYCIYDGKTGEELVNLSAIGEQNEGQGPIIVYGTGVGKGEYHPDYLIPFYPLQDTPTFIITSDVDGDGLGDITQIQGYWDYETYMFLKKLIIIGTKDFSIVSEVKLSSGDGFDNGSLLKVDGSDRYAAVMGQSDLSLLDLSEQKLVASYKVSANKAIQIADDIVVTTPGGELLKLNTDKSFELAQPVPENSADHMLNISWTPAQDYSIMTIKDNGTVVYSGADTSASIPLIQGEHEIDLSMDDGQGKIYKEMHSITVDQQKTFPVLPVVLTAVLLIASLFFGIFRKARIAARFKEAAK